MNVQEYYITAKEIGNIPQFSQTKEAGYLIDALNYDDENNHPSQWIPKVQDALINSYTKYPANDFSTDLLNLYNKGVVIESKPMSAQYIFFALALGIFIGWLIWG